MNLFLLSLIACGEKGSDTASDTAGEETIEETDTGETEVEDTGENSADALAITGEYIDGWGGKHTITDTTWTSGDSVFNISTFDNDLMFLAAQNDRANEYNPEMWSRFDWHYGTERELYYCQIAFDAVDESSAIGTDRADDRDLETGCGGFAWSTLSPAE